MPGNDGARVGPDDLTPEDRREVYGERPSGDWRKFVRPGIWVLVVLFAIIFVASNHQDVEVSFVIFNLQIKLFWLLLFTLLLGAAIGQGARWWWRRRGAAGQSVRPPS